MDDSDLRWVDYHGAFGERSERRERAARRKTPKDGFVRLDGGEIYSIDVRADNLQNIYWKVNEALIISLTKMKDDQLRSIALRLIGVDEQPYIAPEAVKTLWLYAIRLEWGRRMQRRRS